MGLDYSYKMGFRRDQLIDVLQSVAVWARQSDERTDVYLPEGKITVPFTSRFSCEPVLVHDSVGEIQFDASLLFSVADEVLKKYVQENEESFRKNHDQEWTMPRNESGEIAIGNIYLYIQLRDNDQELSEITITFMAATTSMSLLFQDSVSVRRKFLEFSKAQSTSYLLFDHENGGEVLWLDGKELNESVKDVYARDMRKEVRLAFLARQIDSSIEHTNRDEVRARCLRSFDAEVRQIALEVLNDVTQGSLDALLEGLKDVEADVRLKACELLSLRREKHSFEALLARLDDEDQRVRKAACSALFSADEKRAVEPLMRMLQDALPEVRKTAAANLGRAQDKRATAALTKCLKDDDSDVRRCAAQALGEIGDTKAVTALCAFCADEAERISQSLATWRYTFEALGKIGDGRAGGPINHILKNQSGLITNSIVRADAVRALESIGDKNAKKALESLSKES